LSQRAIVGAGKVKLLKTGEKPGTGDGLRGLTSPLTKEPVKTPDYGFIVVPLLALKLKDLA